MVTNVSMTVVETDMTPGELVYLTIVLVAALAFTISLAKVAGEVDKTW